MKNAAFFAFILAFMFLARTLPTSAEGEEGDDAAAVEPTAEAAERQVEAAAEEAAPAAEQAEATAEQAPESTPEPIPAVEEPIPAVEEPVPAVAEPVPAVEEPVPAVEEPVPAVAEPIPAVAEPVPAVAPAKVGEAHEAMVDKTIKETRVDITRKTPAVVKLIQKKEAEVVALKQEITTLQESIKKTTDAGKKLAAADKEIARLKNIVRKIADANKREITAMHNATGSAFMAAGNFRKAEEEFLAAAKLNPNDAATHYNLGVLYEKHVKNKTRAKSHYEKFLELAPKSKDRAKVVEALKSL